MGATWSPDDRGTKTFPRMTRGEWLGGLLVVGVIVGATWLADLLGYWLTGEWS